jgi:hypothetical protein
MFLLFSLALAVPSASDVQAMEVSRVLEPFVDYDRKGRRFVEFAPDVETRAVICVKAAENMADCTYETRIRDFVEPEFGPWETRRERLVRKRKCWVRLAAPSQ